MNIIIPLGGLGSRFIEVGYTLPKPLINLLFKPILFWLLDCLNFQRDDNVIIICNKRLERYRFRELVSKNYGKITVLYLSSDTRGAVETVLHGLSASNLTKPTILLDGDTFYNVDILKMYRELKNKNTVFSFKQQDSKPIYSYVQVKDGIVQQIAEKQPISDLANTGAYAFESGRVLKQYCENAIKKFDTSKQTELYTSSIIADMIKDGYTFTCTQLNSSDFEVVGTPLQYKLFHNKNKTNKKYFKNYRICFDLDNTLVTYPNVPDDYTTVQPIVDNIQYAQFLHEIGCTIIIYTSRRMRTHSGNVGAIISDVGKITLDTIEEYKIPCDELYFGKPYAHAYIDDLAYNAFDNFPSRLGLTDLYVKERDFNSVTAKTLQVFEKRSTNVDKLEAEIYWYKHIPKQLNKYVPKLLAKGSESESSYLMEKIDGITYSELLVSQSLNDDMFMKLLNTLYKFHQHVPTKCKVDIYSNYKYKLENRYSAYDYSTYIGSEQIYKRIHTELDRYEKNNYGVVGCIHGDPVFSNVLIDKNSNIKLVDPRGFDSNNTKTIYGDVMYDYAKVLQSLSGYDEVLLTGERFLDNQSKVDLLLEFVGENYGETYKQLLYSIKDSLLFTLIPLHDNTNCQKYYNLIDINYE